MCLCRDNFLCLYNSAASGAVRALCQTDNAGGRGTTGVCDNGFMLCRINGNNRIGKLNYIFYSESEKYLLHAEQYRYAILPSSTQLASFASVGVTEVCPVAGISTVPVLV